MSHRLRVGADPCLADTDRMSVVMVETATGHIVDNMEAIRRMEDKDRRRAQAEFAALFAEPPKPNRAQRRKLARRGRK